MKKCLAFFILLFSVAYVNAQEKEEEDPSKLIREVIEVQVEKPKSTAPSTPAPPAEETGKKKGKKKQQEEAPVEAPPADEGGTIPAPIAELTKRASNWAKLKNKHYKKDNVANAGSTVSCNAIFIYKPKELNPICDVEGEISMDVIIECKEGKYRYTIKNMKHKSRNQNVHGGNIYNEIPDCGSIFINDLAWKQIKSAAFANASLLAQDIKTTMNLSSEQKKDEW